MVIDTVPAWAGLHREGENASGEALRIMADVARIAEADHGVVAVRHGRKGGGEVGDSARGSSAWGGAADVLVSVRRVDGQGHPNRRVLEAVGRFDGIPAELTVEWRNGEYTALGETGSVTAHDVRTALLDFLPRDPANAMTEEQILQRLDGKAGRSTWQRVRDGLLEDGLIARVEGLGRTGRAHGYHRTARANDVPIPLPLDGQSISTPITAVERVTVEGPPDRDIGGGVVNAEALVRQLRARGVVLEVHGDRLRYRGRGKR